MCGILFSTNLKHSSAGFSESCEKALEKMKRRGPDGRALWFDAQQTVALGHVRLAINDLSETGQQPMKTADGRYVMVCNGEIYNYLALKAELEGKGYVFFSRSDSEVLLYGYQEWGENLLSKLQGMFAFVIWDNKKQTLFAARDHVGMKPLYFFEKDGDFFIASDISTLKIFHPEVQIDTDSLCSVLSMGYVPAPQTIWKNANMLLPGHFLEWSLHTAEFGFSIKEYWKPAVPLPSQKPSSVDELETEFFSLFESVVEEHLLSDVPVCLFLSGGIDSTALAVALANKNLDFEAVTVNFPDAPRAEVENAKFVTSELKIKHRIVDLEKKDIERLIQKTASSYDQPQGYSALLSFMQVCESVSGDYKVVLSGDGGDEVFSGYRWYQDIPRAFHPSFYTLYALLSRFNFDSKILACLERACFARTSLLHHHSQKLFPRFLPHEINAVIQKDSDFDGAAMLEPYRRVDQENLSNVRRLQSVDLMNFCSDSILAKVDRASMHYSLEVRTPFLDKRMLDWAFSLPDEVYPQIKHKALLKKYIHKYLPPQVTECPKQGFSVPLEQSLSKQAMIEAVNKSKLVQTGVLKKNWLDFVEPDFLFAKCWVLYFLALWYEDQ